MKLAIFTSLIAATAAFAPVAPKVHTPNTQLSASPSDRRIFVSSAFSAAF
ncbi:hypothetical protein TrRE_jg555, partial [Triparma retinervis]